MPLETNLEMNLRVERNLMELEKRGLVQSSIGLRNVLDGTVGEHIIPLEKIIETEKVQFTTTGSDNEKLKI